MRTPVMSSTAVLLSSRLVLNRFPVTTDPTAVTNDQGEEDGES